MTAAFISELLEPFSANGVNLPNRIMMSPMVKRDDPDGIPADTTVEYYRKRAASGVGTIVIGSVATEHPGNIEAFGEGAGSTPNFNSEATRAGWKRVVDAVHAEGGKIFPQLLHVGVMKRVTGKPNDLAYAPSATWGPTDRKTANTHEEIVAQSKRPIHEMGDAEVVEVIDGFAQAARRATELGFDGIALHGAHGYLIDGFLWGETNLRTDRWGGDHVGRTRLVVEIIKAIRREVGSEIPVSFRFSQWKPQDFDIYMARNPTELEELLRPIVDAGANILDASARDFSEPAFAEGEENLPYWTRKIFGLPTVMVGGTGVKRPRYAHTRTPPETFDNLDDIMRRFDRGEFDLLAVGRSLLNDPDWLKRVRAGEAFLPFNPQCLNPKFVE